jgi:hypothetical protein
MQFLLFPPTSLKYTDAICVASGNCWTAVSATEDVTNADHAQTSEKLCLSLQGHICETWGSLSGTDIRLQSSRMRCHVDWYAGTDIYKKPVGSIFRVVWRRVTTMDYLEDEGSKLLQNVCSCIPVHIVTSQKSGMFDTTFCAQRIINTWSQINMFFRVIPWDATTLNSHYLITDISTWLNECNEIKGHNTEVDVIYQIVATKISFQFSWMPTQCAAYHTYIQWKTHLQ